MDRVEATGIGVALAGHAALFAALSFGLAWTANPPPLERAMEVSFVDEVALDSAAPQPSAAPAASATPPASEPVQVAVLTPAPAQVPSPAPVRVQERPRPPLPSRRAGLDDLRIEAGDEPAARPSPRPPARMTGEAAADIASAITRQVQPCADRQVYPGPGSERIVTPIVLSLNPDGSLKGRPRIGQQRGVDDENRRYAQRVADLAINAFVSCSPLRGLPRELYDVPRGWSNFTMNYRLPG